MRTPQPWSRRQFADLISAYQAAYERRVRRLSGALIYSLVIVFGTLFAGFMLRNVLPRVAFVVILAVCVAFLVFIVALAVYIVATAGRFKREHALRCDSCGLVLPVLSPKPGTPLWSLKFMRIDEEVPAHVPLHCPRCKALITDSAHT